MWAPDRLAVWNGFGERVGLVMFSVIVSEKGGAERRESFDRPEINVGRVQGNDLMLPKGNVSKRHARLLFRDGRFIVTDLKSTNGTYVNGQNRSGDDRARGRQDLHRRLRASYRGGDRHRPARSSARPKGRAAARGQHPTGGERWW